MHKHPFLLRLLCPAVVISPCCSVGSTNASEAPRFDQTAEEHSGFQFLSPSLPVNRLIKEEEEECEGWAVFDILKQKLTSAVVEEQ